MSPTHTAASRGAQDHRRQGALRRTDSTVRSPRITSNVIHSPRCGHPHLYWYRMMPRWRNNALLVSMFCPGCPVHIELELAHGEVRLNWQG
jgi:hypothetical protein